VSKADVVAAILWIGVTLYAVFGGADFGGGMWDLLAGRSERGERARNLIDHSIAPVWEANHVWLIFILVVLWTAFSTVFSAIMTTLYIPLALAALGIVLRGAGFAVDAKGDLPAADACLRDLILAHPVLHGHGRRRGRFR
jgi:cytochrome d ubiquinol oxidase subunit II